MGFAAVKALLNGENQNRFERKTVIAYRFKGINYTSEFKLKMTF
jgi:hypothetical protein